MPTTPPKKAPKQAATTKTGHHHSPRKKSSRSWWSSPWVPLGPIVAGITLSLGFHVTLRLWELTQTHEPLDLSPPFAAKPLPGTSLDNLTHRYGNQLPPLLNPTIQPGRLPPPPPVFPSNTTNRPQALDINRFTTAAPAIPPTTPEEREDRSAQGQTQTTLTVPPLRQSAELILPPPPPPSLGVP